MNMGKQAVNRMKYKMVFIPIARSPFKKNGIKSYMRTNIYYIYKFTRGFHTVETIKKQLRKTLGRAYAKMIKERITYAIKSKTLTA